jgi:hypothetical protein
MNDNSFNKRGGAMPVFSSNKHVTIQILNEHNEVCGRFTIFEDNDNKGDVISLGGRVALTVRRALTERGFYFKTALFSAQRYVKFGLQTESRLRRLQERPYSMPGLLRFCSGMEALAPTPLLPVGPQATFLLPA